MKLRLLLLSFFIVSTTPLFASNRAISIGVLNGGGSLLGVDYERLFFNNVGIQVGAGTHSVGIGLTVHKTPHINSSHLFLGLWNQGFSKEVHNRMVGASWVFRGKKSGLTGQIGLGYSLSMGSQLEKKMRDFIGKTETEELHPIFNYALLYSIGWWF